jgi:hypothetical protein
MSRPSKKYDLDKKTVRIDVYMDDESKALIQKVCAIKKIPASVFLLDLGTQYATDYLERRGTLTVTD